MEFHNIELRTVLVDGEPWLVATDIYQVLYGKTTGLGTLPKFDENERHVLWKKDLSVSKTITHLFTTGQYRLALLEESGLYKLVMRSDMAQAKEFQGWVTGIVLPAIRKDGAPPVEPLWALRGVA